MLQTAPSLSIALTWATPCDVTPSRIPKHSIAATATEQSYSCRDPIERRVQAATRIMGQKIVNAPNAISAQLSSRRWFNEQGHSESASFHFLK
jgi:nitrate reductase cytochrome c-type subunit